MAENEQMVLSDKNIIPTDEYIYSLLGERKVLWQTILKECLEKHEASGTWNYYNDGKQWLFKMVRKKKTLFWSGIYPDTFRITFYFPDRAEALIDSSELPVAIKEEFKTAKKYGAIRPVSLKVFEHSDVENVLRLVEIKNRIK